MRDPTRIGPGGRKLHLGPKSRGGGQEEPCNRLPEKCVFHNRIGSVECCLSPQNARTVVRQTKRRVCLGQGRFWNVLRNGRWALVANHRISPGCVLSKACVCPTRIADSAEKSWTSCKTQVRRLDVASRRSPGQVTRHSRLVQGNLTPSVPLAERSCLHRHPVLVSLFRGSQPGRSLNGVRSVSCALARQLVPFQSRRLGRARATWPGRPCSFKISVLESRERKPLLPSPLRSRVGPWPSAGNRSSETVHPTRLSVGFLRVWDATNFFGASVHGR